jgi:hypothetical protein
MKGNTMLKLTDKDKKIICEDEWEYVNDEMTDAYNNGEKSLLKARMNFCNNAMVFNKSFTFSDDMTNEEAEETSTENYGNGITGTGYIDGWTGFFYTLFKKGDKEILLKSDVFKVGKMFAYNEMDGSIIREILIPMIKDVGESESEWVLNTEFVKNAIEAMSV